jgi:hypothetical protein
MGRHRDQQDFYSIGRDASSWPTEFLLRPMEFLLVGLQLLLSYA